MALHTPLAERKDLRYTKNDEEPPFQEHPISHAAETGHTGIVVKLLDHGADINSLWIFMDEATPFVSGSCR